MEERIPAEVFPPGEFLADELEARGWTQSEFAGIIRRPEKLVMRLLRGESLLLLKPLASLRRRWGQARSTG